MYLVHSDRLLTRYDLQLHQFVQLNIRILYRLSVQLEYFLLFVVALFEQMFCLYKRFYLYKRFDICKLFKFNEHRMLKARGSSIYVFCTDYLSSLNIFYCLKLFYLNICSVYTNYSIHTRDSVYTN